MKKFEKILIKIIVIQFIFLILSQLVFHHWQAFPEMKQLIKYEGVTKNEFSQFLQAFMAK